ncbi:MAG: glycoside hydrolase family 2 TIM barrel-domain containing protein [Balneolaceae bacterium]
MIRFFYLLPIIVLFGCNDASIKKSIDHTKLFNSDWEFVKDIDEELPIDELADKESTLIWEAVSLPHTANIEPLVIEDQQWQGTSYYRKYFSLNSDLSGKHIAIKFEAVMHEAEVYLNGEKVYYNAGGYLPFVVDISNAVNFGEENVLLLKVNNEDNPEIPPGKPIADLDFNYYGGIYRDAYLIIKDQLRISDPILANRTAAGGVFVHFKNVTNDDATVVVQTDIENGRNENSSVTLNVILRDQNGKQVSNKESKIQIDQLSNYIQIDELKVKTPELWSPNSPTLYTLGVQLFDESGLIDSYQQKIGIRTFGFDENNQFTLNGETLYLRGTNRHQDYPYIGYALSNEAQYRDAYKIKKAGFNFVRTAHYPPDPAFLEACDELGLLFMDAIPGWQFFGNELFQERALTDVRKMIRRDRNHPSIVIWEASLNESGMPEEFMELADSVVKEELPIQDVYTSGWLDHAYDIFIPARQHSKPPLYWSDYEKDKPLFIAEYGDWEYYAQNAGFNQTAYENLKEEERNSRQLRGDGQRRLAQQALNFQEAHNSNLKGNSFGDANWVMYDYNRGYAPDLEASGIQDIFRIPKFVNYFYQSQTNPDLTKDASEFNGPMVYIANYWSDLDYTEVKVFSNADEVALVLNGEEISRKSHDSDRVSTHLNHPPFTFQIDSFTPGELVANAYFNSELLATHKRITPAEPSKIVMEVDLSGKEVQSNTNDVIFVYANITDQDGNLIFNASNKVSFKIEGNGELIGGNPIHAEAGTATILLKAGQMPDNIKITAVSEGLEAGSIQIKSN